MAPIWDALYAWLLELAGRLVGVVVILIVGGLAIRFLVGPLRRLLARARVEPSVGSFLTNSVRGLILVVVLLGVLQQLGVQTTSLLAILGAAGVAIALSLQNSLANFASGLLILSFRVVRIGDQIEMGDVRGRVEEMLPFHVVLITIDQQRITVPNTMLTNTPVRNLSTLPTRRAQWTLNITPDDDLAAVREALQVLLRADPRILQEPGPQVVVQEWADVKRVLSVTAWTNTAGYLAVQQDMLEKLGRELDDLRRRRTPESTVGPDSVPDKPPSGSES